MPGSYSCVGLQGTLADCDLTGGLQLDLAGYARLIHECSIDRAVIQPDSAVGYFELDMSARERQIAWVNLIACAVVGVTLLQRPLAAALMYALRDS